MDGEVYNTYRQFIDRNNERVIKLYLFIICIYCTHSVKGLYKFNIKVMRNMGFTVLNYYLSVDQNCQYP